MSKGSFTLGFVDIGTMREPELDECKDLTGVYLF